MIFDIRVIGHVENEITERQRIRPDGLISRIVLDPSYLEALDGIDKFSHIVVIFWLDRIKDGERGISKVHPRGDDSIPLTGVFATRSPVRPNPIAITTVELVERKGNVLTVKGLDAMNGTPVLDIKAYIPEKITGGEIKVPGWVNKKRREDT
jgi:tRNA (adenine37-N6)-methyltransferase